MDYRACRPGESHSLGTSKGLIMQDGIWAFEPATAIEHIEGNLYGFWRFCGACEDRVLFTDGRLTWVSSHPYAMPNLIFNPRLHGVDLDEYLPGLVTRIRQGNCPKIWVRGHDDGPPGLYERLAGLGFVEVARRPTMAINLQHPPRQVGESIYRRLGFLGFSRLMLYEWKG